MSVGDVASVNAVNWSIAVEFEKILRQCLVQRGSDIS